MYLQSKPKESFLSHIYGEIVFPLNKEPDKNIATIWK
jgi:hypothetical protein